MEHHAWQIYNVIFMVSTYGWLVVTSLERYASNNHFHWGFLWQKRTNINQQPAIDWWYLSLYINIHTHIVIYLYSVYYLYIHMNYTSQPQWTVEKKNLQSSIIRISFSRWWQGLQIAGLVPYSRNHSTIIHPRKFIMEPEGWWVGLMFGSAFFWFHVSF